jgi:Domain of unknown function (DUF4258)
MQTRQLTKTIRSLIAAGKVRVLKHASERMALRGYTLPEVEQILRSGFHEQNHDEFEAKFDTWRHAIRGSTIDGRQTRVIVAIVDDLLVITVVGPLK